MNSENQQGQRSNKDKEACPKPRRVQVRDSGFRVEASPGFRVLVRLLLLSLIYYESLRFRIRT